jgi:sulfhydrogenase subunit beta (sulfur reductase)
MFKIAKSKLPELLKAIAAQQELFLPVNNNGQVNFAAWFEGCNADIETLKTVKSPKDMFFPQSETLYTVKKEQHKLSVEPQTLADQNFVAFGMKACDIQGIKVLDKVFLAEPVDTFYRARREHGTIVAPATSRRSPASVRFSALTALSRTPMSSCGTQTTRSTGKL